MAMSDAALKAKIYSTVYNGLKKAFSPAAGAGAGYEPVADAQWQKMAEAISGIAMDIVAEVKKAETNTPGAGPGVITG